MTLRARLTLAAIAAAAIAVLGVSIVGVAFTRHRLRDQVDRSLLAQAERIAASPYGGGPAGSGSGDRSQRGRSGNDHHTAPDGDGDERLDVGTGAFQVIDRDGKPLRQASTDVRDLSVDDADIAVARRSRPALLRDVFTDSVHLRVATVPAGTDQAVITARPVDDIDGTVKTLALGFAVIGASAIALAGLLGTIVAKRALAPVDRLSRAAETVAATQDASLPVPETGGRELARLGHSLNVMLASLAGAREHERRLIDDAAHELRTPLTSLRTNVEVLTSGRPLDDADRAELLRDVRGQVEEFAGLVGDLDTLARGEQAAGPADDVDLRAVVNAAVRRAQRRAGPVRIEPARIEPASIEPARDAPARDEPARDDGAVGAEPATSHLVHGHAAMLERAVLNVLDNAVKWSPAGGVVTVALDGTTVTVTDRGPGIAAADLPHVFDRFWRSQQARSMPGSGLGLAIVRQVIEAHGGTVAVQSPAPSPAAASPDAAAVAPAVAPEAVAGTPARDAADHAPWATSDSVSAERAGPGTSVTLTLPAVS